MDKIRLISHLGIIEAIRLSMAVSVESLPHVQAKKDIRFDGKFLLSEEAAAIAKD